MTCELPDHAAAVEALLEGFVRVCQLCIEAGLAPTDPLDSNVRYQLEPQGQEDWKLPQNCVRDGWGDCEDIAGWRAGGLRATGADPSAVVRVARTGSHKLHAVVQRGDGSIEDPSLELWERQTGRSLGATEHEAYQVRNDYRTPEGRKVQASRARAVAKTGGRPGRKVQTPHAVDERGQPTGERQGWQGDQNSVARQLTAELKATSGPAPITDAQAREEGMVLDQGVVRPMTDEEYGAAFGYDDDDAGAEYGAAFGGGDGYDLDADDDQVAEARAYAAAAAAAGRGDEMDDDGGPYAWS